MVPLLARPRFKWYLDLGVRAAHLRLREHDADELAHYSIATGDIEYAFPIGGQELEGVANRGDYDLRQHTEGRARSSVIGQEERYVPYVIEPAVGVGRATLAFMCEAYRGGGRRRATRTVFTSIHVSRP